MEELIKKCKASVNIEINEHKNMYQTVEEKIKEINERDCSFNRHIDNYEPEISEELSQELIKADTIYELQFYPDTPIGSYTVYGISLEDVSKKALNILKEL